MINIREIEEIFETCIIENKKNRIEENVITIDGRHKKYVFDVEKITRYRTCINNIIDKLDLPKDTSISFVNFCIDHNNNVWTDSIDIGEKLILLGILIGKLKYTAKPCKFILPSIVLL